jgi:hypothetical protein
MEIIIRLCKRAGKLTHIKRQIREFNKRTDWTVPLFPTLVIISERSKSKQHEQCILCEFRTEAEPSDEFFDVLGRQTAPFLPKDGRFAHGSFQRAALLARWRAGVVGISKGDYAVHTQLLLMIMGVVRVIA